MKKNLTALARRLRKRSTEAEIRLWLKFSRRQLEGYKFRRQQPIGKYIVDFVNHEKKIIIELDGSQHAVEKMKDRKRDKWLEQQGFTILRFWDNQVLENVGGVLETVRNRLLSPSLIPSHQGREESLRDEQ